MHSIQNKNILKYVVYIETKIKLLRIVSKYLKCKCKMKSKN